MNVSKKRASTQQSSSRGAVRAAEGSTAGNSFIRLAKATARGVLIAAAMAVLLSAAAAGIAYATADPDAMTVPLALCAMALSALVGGFTTYRACRISPLVSGALCALALLFVFFVISCLLPDALRGQWPSGVAWGLRAGMMAFSLLGAILGSYAPMRRKKKKKHALR